VTRGEVWWMEHPVMGRRPACILTRSEAIPVLTGIVVAPATSHIRGTASEVEVGTRHGMPRTCVFSLDNLSTVPKSNLVDHITTLHPAQVARICLSLRFAMGC